MNSNQNNNNQNQEREATMKIKIKREEQTIAKIETKNMMNRKLKPDRPMKLTRRDIRRTWQEIESYYNAQTIS